MNVLLLNPPFLKNFSRSQRSPAVTKSGTLYFPLWLASAAGLLESRGIGVDLIDAPADCHDMDYVLQRARGFQPDLIVVDTSTPSIANDVGIAAQLKDAFPNVLRGPRRHPCFRAAGGDACPERTGGRRCPGRIRQYPSRPCGDAGPEGGCPHGGRVDAQGEREVRRDGSAAVHRGPRRDTLCKHDVQEVPAHRELL